MEKVHFPIYTHRPVKIVYWEVQEAAMFLLPLVTCIFGRLVGMTGWMYMASLLLPFLLIKIGRDNPRGYYRHLMFRCAIEDFGGYPPSTAKRFNE